MNISLGQAPRTFRLDGVEIAIPDDLSHIPAGRRRKLINSLQAAYPKPGADDISNRLLYVALHRGGPSVGRAKGL